MVPTEFLKRQREKGLLRQLRPISERRGGSLLHEGKEYIDLSSNDYLGLSAHPELIEKTKEAVDKFGAGTCASRLLSGDMDLHHRLEDETARFKNKEAALVFNSGYQANAGIISALFGKSDAIFSDKLNHASIVDGMLLSGSKIFRFRHNDLNHLKALLEEERSKFQNALIVTETVFSMDGDRPDLKGMVELKEKFDCRMMVDEAHATGIYGKSGSGVVEEEGLVNRIEFIMGTFSKALGSFGAYLAASKETVDFLINTCRSFIYSTALPPPVIGASLAAVELIRKEPERRATLLERTRYFHEALRARGFTLKGSSQIVPLIIGDNVMTVRMADELRKRGWWVLPIRHPTVPKGEARLRFSLTLYHDIEILKRLVNDISRVEV